MILVVVKTMFLEFSRRGFLIYCKKCQTYLLRTLAATSECNFRFGLRMVGRTFLVSLSYPQKIGIETLIISSANFVVFFVLILIVPMSSHWDNYESRVNTRRLSARSKYMCDILSLVKMLNVCNLLLCSV